MNIRVGDYVMYKNESLRVREVDFMRNLIYVLDVKKGELIGLEVGLVTPVTRGQTYLNENQEKFYDNCLDKINILSYNKRVEQIKALEELMAITTILKGK